jgi:penicillin-binding protein
MGFSPEVTVGVWVGYDQPSPLLINQGAGHHAKNIWSLIMDRAIELRPELFDTTTFEKPEDIITMTVSGISGLLPTEKVRAMGRLTTDLFDRKKIPTQEDHHVVESEYVTVNGLNYLPSENTPPDMIKKKTFIVRETNIYETLAQIERILKELPADKVPKKRGVPMTVRDYYPQDIAETAPMLPMPAVADDGPPNPPTQLRLEATGDNTYAVRFVNSDSRDAVGYRFYQSVNGEPFKRVNGKTVAHGADPAFYVVQNPANVYAYYITTVDASGLESAPSEIVYSNPAVGELLPDIPTVPGDGAEHRDGDQPGMENGRGNDGADGTDDAAAALPSAPRNVRATASDDGLSVVVSWSANPGSDSVLRYEIYHSNDPAGPFVRIGSSNATRYYHQMLVPTPGWYQVVAVNAAGSSPPSDPVEFRPPDDAANE